MSRLVGTVEGVEVWTDIDRVEITNESPGDGSPACFAVQLAISPDDAEALARLLTLSASRAREMKARDLAERQKRGDGR